MLLALFMSALNISYTQLVNSSSIEVQEAAMGAVDPKQWSSSHEGNSVFQAQETGSQVGRLKLLTYSDKVIQVLSIWAEVSCYDSGSQILSNGSYYGTQKEFKGFREN